MTKLFTSKKNIISIQEFMTNYVGKAYDGNEKLTHHVMAMYLCEKGLPFVSKVNFAAVTKENIMTGKYILVKDENNQILGYENPKNHSLDSLLCEIKSQNSKRNLERIRKNLLKEAGYTHDTDGTVITTEEFEQNEQEAMLTATDKVNRQKYICRRHYY